MSRAASDAVRCVSSAGTLISTTCAVSTALDQSNGDAKPVAGDK
jgi:hypothetical protein